MKKIILVVLFLTLALNIFAQSKRFGIGMILGQPTGFTTKFWFLEYNSFNTAFAWSLFESDSVKSFYVHLDHAFYYYGLFDIASGSLPLSVGVGLSAEFRTNESTLIGFRVPVGLTYIFKDIPIEIFGEIAPVINIYPNSNIKVVGGIGFRYFF